MSYEDDVKKCERDIVYKQFPLKCVEKFVV